jgi:protein-disulfide isomerase
MLKRMLVIGICLLFSSVIAAQDSEPDCSPVAISEALDIALFDAQTAIANGDDPAVVLSTLQATLDGLQTDCMSAPTAPTTAGSNNLGWDEYADLPQWRQPDGGFVLGDPEARFTIVEFLDYACPHCQYYVPVREQIIDELVRTGEANYEVRVFPTAGGQLTAFVGQVVACLEDQREGSFWAAQDMLFDMAVNGKFNETTAETVADKLGLDYDKALGCAAEHAEVGDGQLVVDVELASNLGVQATPTIMLREEDGVPQFITYQATTYTAGAVPFEGIAAVINGELGGAPL